MIVLLSSGKDKVGGDIELKESYARSSNTVYTEGWKAYGGLILNGYEHYRNVHSENEFARGKNHINGTLSFW